MPEKYQKRIDFIKELRDLIEEITSLVDEDYGVVDDDVWSSLMNDIEDDVHFKGKGL